MKELDELLLEIVDAQTYVLRSYKKLIGLVEDRELRSAFKENFRHMAVNHKEIIFHLKEKLEGLEPDSESEDDEEDEG